MSDDDSGLDISRRKIIGSAATLGAAGALGGAGTGALLWDEEKFGNLSDPNVLEGGELDLKVDWEVRYYDWIDTTDQLIAQSELTDQPGPIVDLQDVKPGDVMEATLSAHVFGNPAFLGWHYQEHLDSDNGINEPEDKVNGHTPDGSDGDPFANAGFGGLVGGLLAGAIPGQRFRGEDEEGGVLSRKNLLRTAGAAGAGAAGVGAMGTAAAAPGDTLGNVGLPNSTSGVGIAFTGEYVIVPDGFGTNEIDIYTPPATGDGTATYVASKTLPNTISGIAWDGSRNQLWATYDGSTFWLVDLGDPTTTGPVASMTSEFSAPGNAIGWPADGLAYDGGNDTVWWSPDGSLEVWEFQIDGSLASQITPAINANGDPFNHISGIATGAPLEGRPTLYLGDNPEQANGSVIRVYADTGEFVSGFADQTGFRVEDMSCDPHTYAPNEAILVTDTSGFYRAYEVEAGTCPVGGTQGDDGELDDVMQCVVWYDDGNNIPEEIWTGQTDLGDPGPDESLDAQTLEDYVMEVGEAQSPSDIVDTSAALFAGTLADMDGADVMFNAQNSVAGSVATDFPDSWCYQNSVTEYIGVLCWVPRDIPGVNDNVIQTDRLEFQFGFDAIQCRHNVANDGGPLSGTIDEADAENNANSP